MKNESSVYQFDNAANGDVHTFEPSDEKPPAGTILDKRGDVIEKLGWMVRIDNKAKEPITLSRGTLGLVALLLPALMVIFYYGSGLLGIAREDQRKEMQIQALENAVKQQGDDIKEVKSMLQKERDERIEERIAAAKALGYQLKAAEGPEHGAQK